MILRLTTGDENSRFSALSTAVFTRNRLRTFDLGRIEVRSAIFKRAATVSTSTFRFCAKQAEK